MEPHWGLSLEQIHRNPGHLHRFGRSAHELTGVSADIDDYLNSANQIHPRSGTGYEFNLLGRYPLGESYYIYGRAGLFTVDSVYRANAGADFARGTRDETTEVAGVSVGKILNRRWDLRLGLDRYSVENETIPVLGLGAIYKFGSNNSTTPVKPRSPHRFVTSNTQSMVQASESGK